MATSVNFSNNDLQSVVKNRIIFLQNRPFEGVHQRRERTVPPSCSSFSFLYAPTKKQYRQTAADVKGHRKKKRVAEDDTKQETQR
jgi:hypothetical protein